MLTITSRPLKGAGGMLVKGGCYKLIYERL